jgi:hypothetical protein
MMIVFIAVGILFVFFGRKLFKIIVFMIGVILTVGAVWIVFYTFFKTDEMEQWIGWGVFGGSLLVGCLIGWLLTKVMLLGAFLLAAWGGFTVGLLVYNAFL